MQLTELVAYLDQLLAVASFNDYCPNGLQVQGRSEVHKIVGGVTACQALLDRAVTAQADAVLVHHGWFWKGEDPRIVGIKQRRLATLLRHDMSLIAYHLPLDAHQQFGNNVQLAQRLGITITGIVHSQSQEPSLVLQGELPEPLSAAQFSKRIEAQLKRRPLHISGGDQLIKCLAWCSGAAQSALESAIIAGVDAFITGEVSEPTMHIAREYGVHFFAAGHHATERYGIQALGDHLAQQFPLAFTFVDIENPV